MTGPFHLRAVATIFILSGIFVLIPFALSLFQPGGPRSPTGAVAGMVDIGLAIWLTRGSQIARCFLAVFSGLGLLLCGALFFLGARGAPEVALPAAVGVILCGYCVWALTLSPELGAELALRLEARKKFYDEADPFAERQDGERNGVPTE
jgi:hypothetical protein